jgi:hypothetical protein
MSRSGRLGAVVAVAALLASGLACNYSGPVSINAWGWRFVRGSGVVAEEIRNVSDFDCVVLSGTANLFVEQGDEHTLRIEAEDNLLRYIETHVEGSTLDISTNHRESPRIRLRPTEPIRVFLQVRDLKEVRISGVGTVEAGDLVSDRFTVGISGGGDVAISGLTADALDVVVSGVGNLDIGGGSVAAQRIRISGGANYDARRLKSDRASVSVSGLGAVTLWASDRLDVGISGGGTVTYDGSPQVYQKVSGLGRVDALRG